MFHFLLYFLKQKICMMKRREEFRIIIVGIFQWLMNTQLNFDSPMCENKKCSWKSSAWERAFENKWVNYLLPFRWGKNVSLEIKSNGKLEVKSDWYYFLKKRKELNDSGVREILCCFCSGTKSLSTIFFVHERVDKL